MSSYWLDRQSDRLNYLDKLVEDHIKNLRKLMINAADNLEREIFDLYVKYADDNNMGYHKAVQYLSDDEREEFQKDLKYYIETSKDATKVITNRAELQALSTRARIKRLEKLQTAIYIETDKLHQFLIKDTKDMINLVYEDSYLYNIFNIENYAKVGIKFDLAPTKTVEQLLNHPWSGSNYSSKVWDKTEGFAKALDNALTVGLIQGKSIDALARDLRHAIEGKNSKGGQLYKYKRLVRTEAAFIAEQATMKSYNDCNLEEYEFLATLDTKTSELCQDLDGEVFKVKDAITGKNYPPMHAFCRSTTVPKITWDDEPEVLERISRDPITGKNKKSKDMTYKEWKNTYYNG